MGDPCAHGNSPGITVVPGDTGSAHAEPPQVHLGQRLRLSWVQSRCFGCGGAEFGPGRYPFAAGGGGAVPQAPHWEQPVTSPPVPQICVPACCSSPLHQIWLELGKKFERCCARQIHAHSCCSASLASGNPAKNQSRTWMEASRTAWVQTELQCREPFGSTYNTNHCPPRRLLTSFCTNLKMLPLQEPEQWARQPYGDVTPPRSSSSKRWSRLCPSRLSWKWLC